MQHDHALSDLGYNEKIGNWPNCTNEGHVEIQRDFM